MFLTFQFTRLNLLNADLNINNPEYLRIETETYKYNDEQLEIILNYPRIMIPVDQGINKMIKEEVLNKAKKFKREIFEWNQSGIQYPMKSCFEINYEIKNKLYPTLSLLFYIYNYYAGAAHPNTFTYSLNYDIDQHQHILFEDYINKNQFSWKKISMYCYFDFMQRDISFDHQWVKNGTKPISLNYHTWNILKNGLEVTFDPYQVSCYAAGLQTIFIDKNKYNQLKKNRY